MYIKLVHQTKPVYMPRAKKKLVLTQPIKEGLKPIKVRLDHRTVITLASLKAFEFWKTRYPQAMVIDGEKEEKKA